MGTVSVDQAVGTGECRGTIGNKDSRAALPVAMHGPAAPEGPRCCHVASGSVGYRFGARRLALVINVGVFLEILVTPPLNLTAVVLALLFFCLVTRPGIDGVRGTLAYRRRRQEAAKR